MIGSTLLLTLLWGCSSGPDAGPDTDPGRDTDPGTLDSDSNAVPTTAPPATSARPTGETGRDTHATTETADSSGTPTSDTAPAAMETADTAPPGETADTGRFALPTCGELELVHHLAAGGDDLGFDLEGTPDGGFVVGGSFESSFTIDLPAGPTTFRPAAWSDGMVIKYDADGRATWVQQIYGLGRADVVDVDTHADGRVAVMGTIGRDAYAAHGRTDELLLPYRDSPTIGQDLFVVVYDSAGKALWGTTFGGPSLLLMGGVAFGDDGEVYVAGQYNAADAVELGPVGSGVDLPVDFDHRQSTFFVRLSTAGKLEWVRVIGGYGYQYAAGVVRAGPGVVVVGGKMAGAITFSLGTDDAVTVAPDFQYSPTLAYLAGYGPQGDLLWYRLPGSMRMNDQVRDLVAGPGGVELIGESGNEAVFGADEPDEVIIPRNEFASYAARYAADGDFEQLVLPAGQSASIRLYAFGLDHAPNGHLAIGGVLNGKVSLGAGANAETVDPGPNHWPIAGIYEQDGTYRCLITHETTSDVLTNEVNEVWFDGQGRLWVLGTFLGRLTLAKGTRQERTLYSGGTDMFLARYRLVE